MNKVHMTAVGHTLDDVLAQREELDPCEKLMCQQVAEKYNIGPKNEDDTRGKENVKITKLAAHCHHKTVLGISMAGLKLTVENNGITEEKFREDFKTAFSVISKNPRLNGVLSFLIKVLSVNFKSISDFPCV